MSLIIKYLGEVNEQENFQLADTDLNLRWFPLTCFIFRFNFFFRPSMIDASIAVQSFRIRIKYTCNQQKAKL